MITLKLFNAVLYKNFNNLKNKSPFISEEGYIIEPGALWSKDQIIKYYEKQKLNGEDLNKTFHKSWQKIKDSTRYELFIEQIKHYISTYGSNFQDEIYIPDEVLELPENIKLKFKIIKAYTEEEMIEKCLNILRSGIALEEETINDLIILLADTLNYKFTGKENIKNKEAIVKLAEEYNVYPDNPVEFFRYIIYRTTNQTLLINSADLIDEIKFSDYNPTLMFKKYGLEKLAEIFNRFKPLFLAYKDRSGKTINRISKLSKKYHKPIIQNPLNNVTNEIFRFKEDFHWLENATPYALFKALSACHNRRSGQSSFVYRIRNGKSWVTEKKDNSKLMINEINYNFILSYMKKRFNLNGLKIYIPDNIKYGLPTSEKMFIGNIPTGTKIYGDRLCIGVYWEDEWGADDLDLSGVSLAGKIGWNSDYKYGGDRLFYSGDITSAPSGAVEYLYVNNNLNTPFLIQNNVYTGDNNCKYKIIIGNGDDINKKYMMNPDNLIINEKCQAVQKQMILGMLIPEIESGKQSFVLLNFGAGNIKISNNNKSSNIALNALYQQWKNPISFNDIVVQLGAEVVDNVEEANKDFSIDNIEKDSFIEIFCDN